MNFQDASNLQIPEGYVRTIHDKDSRLLWGSVGYDVSFDGDSYQQTYSGKNLADYLNTTYGTQGAIITRNPNNVVVTKMLTGEYRYVTLPTTADNVNKMLGKSVTLTFKKTSSIAGHRSGIRVFWVSPTFSTGDNIAYAYDTTNGSKSVSFNIPATIPNSSYPIIGLLMYPDMDEADPSSSSVMTISDLQLEVGTATAYEPYVGGTASPNPDYPQAIQTVTGENLVKVTGKNLAWTGWAQDFVTRVNSSTYAKLETFDGKNCVWWKDNTGYGAYDTKYILKTDFQENTQYTMSCDVFPSQNFALITFAYTDGTISGRLTTLTPNQWQHITITSDAGKTVKYVREEYSAGNVYVDIDSFQLELGSQATSYEAYNEQEFPIDLGSIELAKIGTYTDGITRVGTKWYIEKQVGKMVLDGSNSGITWARSTVGSNYAFWFRNNMTDALTNAHKKICDKFTYSNKSFLGAPSPSLCENSESYGPAAYMFIFKVPSSLATTIADWTTWLASNPTTVYYALATPTTTEITDATLIAQLEAVYDWVRRHGYNASVTGNLPIVINRTALPTA